MFVFIPMYYIIIYAGSAGGDLAADKDGACSDPGIPSPVMADMDPER